MSVDGSKSLDFTDSGFKSNYALIVLGIEFPTPGSKAELSYQ